MEFKNWLLTEVRLESPAEFKKLWLRKSYVVFHVDPAGNIALGYGDDKGSWGPYFELVGIGRERSLRVHNVQPTSKLFKDVVAALRPLVPDIEQMPVGTYGLGHASTPKKVSRTVGYFLGHEDTDFAPGGKMPEALYHGTCTELWYEGISTSGLVPRKMNKVAGTGSYGAQGLDSLSHDDKVYLSSHPDNACRMAAQQAAQAHGGKPLIVRVSTAGLFPEKFTHDEDFDSQVKHNDKVRAAAGLRPKLAAQVSQLGMGTVAYVGRIPASQIEPFVMKEGGKWVRFQDHARAPHPLTGKFNSPSGLDSYDSPHFYSMVDSGLGKYTDGDERAIRGGDVPDAEVRRVIKNAPWATDAKAIARDLNDFGQGGIKSLPYLNTTALEPEDQKIVDMLVGTGIYHDEGGYLGRASTWRPTGKVIALAKMLHQNKMTYQDLLRAVDRLDKKYDRS